MHHLLWLHLTGIHLHQALGELEAPLVHFLDHLLISVHLLHELAEVGNSFGRFKLHLAGQVLHDSEVRTDVVRQTSEEAQLRDKVGVLRASHTSVLLPGTAHQQRLVHVTDVLVVVILVVLHVCDRPIAGFEGLLRIF
uniref:Putative secreted protein n=1 Tax=Ixodes ricinus TaxID=34613 RepID=A0A6B0USQ4_IXORI